MNVLLIVLLLFVSQFSSACDLISRMGFEAQDDLPWLTESTGMPSDRHTARPLGSTNSGQGYYEYLPQGYECGDQDYPLMVFIHGLGENGNGTTDLDDLLSNGPPRLINNNSWDENLPFVVLSPQNSANSSCTSSSDIANFIDFAKTTYRINPRRVYLTGLSCGAIGSWNYLRHHTNSQIAATVPIAGNGTSAFNGAGCDLNKVPIWAFHGDADSTVNVSGTTGPINNLLACTDPAPIDTSMVIYPSVGHNSWRRTYDLSAGHDIYEWFLSHRNDQVVIPNDFETGRSIYVDFGSGGETTASPWNNITSTFGASHNAMDDLERPTTVNVTIVDAFNGINTNGSSSNDIGYPDSVGVDNLWLGSHDSHQAALLESASVHISGLTPQTTYEVTLFASRTGNDGGNGRLTRYTINGQHQDLEVSDNTANSVTFSVLSSGAHFDLNITVSPDGTARYAYLGALVLTRVD